MPTNGLQNASEADFIIGVRGKQFVLNEDAELVVGIGKHQFMFSYDYNAQTVYLTDPNTGEKLNIRIKDAIIDNIPIKERLDIISRIQEIIDVTTTGIEVVDENSHVSVIKEVHLNTYTLRETTQLQFDDLREGEVIYRIDIVISTPFETVGERQLNLSIKDSKGAILVPNTWSDPNKAGNYTTSISYTATNNAKLIIQHDMADATAGIGYIRIFTKLPKTVY